MSVPFYVAPEQLMKDRAEYARKGIARGRSVIVMQYRDGICFVADNPSRTLHKISEIYDQIGFAAVGRYNEFESLRILGIRYADLRGYSYHRRDVQARGLANNYAQQLGFAFSSGADKPIEAEISIAELGDEPSEDQIFVVSFDGTIADAQGFAVMGGNASQLSSQVADEFDSKARLAKAIKLANQALGSPESLEVAVLDRNIAKRRKFRRLTKAEIKKALATR